MKKLGAIWVMSLFFIGVVANAIPSDQINTMTTGSVDLHIYQTDITISNPTPHLGDNVILGATVRNRLSFHPPIFINGDADFDAAHGVTGGNGTATDPWIIESYDIEDAGLGYGIVVTNTNQHFIIRNCVVHNIKHAGSWPLYYGKGILLYNTQNGIIQNNTVYSCWGCGINLVSANYNTIINNNASKNKQGIFLDESDHSIISNNIANSNNNYGIHLQDGCDYNIIDNNLVSSNANDGIVIDYTYSHGNTITNNEVSFNSLGIHLDESYNNEIYHNNLINNTNQAYDDRASSTWDDGYPSGGNYWSDYSGSDSNNDGIGDTPYTFSGGTDRYPLMDPKDNTNVTKGPSHKFENASCTVSIYIDNISSEKLIYEQNNVSVPGGGYVKISTNWTVNVTGNHLIIVEITNINPIDNYTTNNIASRLIRFGQSSNDTAKDDWPMLGRDLQHTGYHPNSDAPDEPNLLWEYALDKNRTDGDYHYYIGSPIAAYGMVYIGGIGENKTFFCHDQENGDIIWSFEMPRSICSTPIADNGFIYLNAGELYCFDAHSGDIFWSYPIGGLGRCSPVIVNENLYVGSGSKLFCFSKANGTVLWSFSTAADMNYATPAYSNGKLFFTNQYDSLYCIDAFNGTEIWKKPIGLNFCDPLVANGKVYVGNFDKFYCRNESTGELIWSILIDGRSSFLPAFYENMVYIPTFDRAQRFYCLNASTGTQIWKKDFGTRSAPAIANGKIYIGGGTDHFKCLDAYTGEIIWTYERKPWNMIASAKQGSSPAICDGRIFVGSTDGTLYCFGIPNPQIDEWPMLGRDLLHTGYNPISDGPDAPNVLWSFSLPNPPGEHHYFCNGGPIVSCGNVYIGAGGDNGTFFCFDKETGTLQWSKYFGQPISTAVADDGRIYVSGDYKFYCLDAYTGDVFWSNTTHGQGSVCSAPIIIDERLYYGKGLGLKCVNKYNGSLIWYFPTSGNVQYSSPAYSNGKVFFTSTNDYIYCVDALNGTEIWKRNIDAWHNDVSISNGRVFVGSLNKFYCLDENTGNITWDFIPQYRASFVPGVYEDKVIVPSFYAYYGTPGVTYCLNVSTGDIIWETNIGSRAGPAIADGKVYLGDSWSNLACLDLNNGDVLWNYDSQDPPYVVDSSHAPCPAICDGNLYVATYEGTLYCIGKGSNTTATATGPQGAGHDPIITITYDCTGLPTAVDLFYSNDTGNSWNYLGTDTSVDGFYEWGPASNPAPKPSKYWWIANAQNGSDDVGIPANGTPPEAGPYNWKTHDLKINDGQPILNPSDNWELVSVPLDVSGDPRYVFDDDKWGDGGTKWDVIQWYDPLDPADSWKSYSIYRPPAANDAVIVDNTRGFWIHIINNDGDGALTVGEGSMLTSTSIQLYTGWNLVGYPSLVNETVANALWGTGADKVEVFDPAEPYRIKEVGPTYIMKPGEGYWVHVVADSVWIVDW